jgi:hypothetical protein
MADYDEATARALAESRKALLALYRQRELSQEECARIRETISSSWEAIFAARDALARIGIGGDEAPPPPHLA